jgi:acyl-CoA dehydrogenase
VSSHLHELEDVVSSVLSDRCTPTRLSAGAGHLDSDLWTVLSDAGFTRIGIPEEAGGAGGSQADAAVVVRLAGTFAAQIPLAESLLAGWLLMTAGLALPEGVLTVGCGQLTATPSAHGWRIVGHMPRVAYARAADAIAGIARGPDGPVVFVVSCQQVTITEGTNLAGEPRDSVRIDADAAHAHVADERIELDLLARGRLAGALMLTGALQSAPDSTVRYAGEREQFGRRIGAFQAVQQQVARAAGEVAASRAAVDRAVVALDGTTSGNPARLSACVAKARSSAAAGVVAGIAHQVHGAIGITHEHPLRFATTRLWSWRDEWSNESQCAEELTRAAVAAEDDDLWSFLVQL